MGVGGGVLNAACLSTVLNDDFCGLTENVKKKVHYRLLPNPYLPFTITLSFHSTLLILDNLLTSIVTKESINKFIIINCFFLELYFKDPG
jgi:hypothetical protein